MFLAQESLRLCFPQWGRQVEQNAKSNLLGAEGRVGLACTSSIVEQMAGPADPRQFTTAIIGHHLLMYLFP